MKEASGATTTWVALVQRHAADEGHPSVAMSIAYTKMYRHFRGLSWRKEPGLRSFRHYGKVARIYGRLLLRRITRVRDSARWPGSLHLPTPEPREGGP